MFALRVDIDSIICVREGAPRMLDILSKYGVKASFFCPMGWEGDLLSVIKHRFIRTKRGLPNPSFVTKLGAKTKVNTSSTINGYLQLVKALVYPPKFSKEVKILQRIRDEGHDLGVHGYVHARWRNPNRTELENEFKKMTATYSSLFNETPAGLTTPLFASSPEILQLTDAYGFKYASFLEGDVPFYPTVDNHQFKHIQIPLTTNVDKIHPPLFYYFMQGLSDAKIVENTIHLLDKKLKQGHFTTIYTHPKDEGRYLAPHFEKVIKHIAESGYEVKTFGQIAHTYKNEF